VYQATVKRSLFCNSQGAGNSLTFAMWPGDNYEDRIRMTAYTKYEFYVRGLLGFGIIAPVWSWCRYFSFFFSNSMRAEGAMV
jgi:hypothetical protein